MCSICQSPRSAPCGCQASNTEHGVGKSCLWWLSGATLSPAHGYLEVRGCYLISSALTLTSLCLQRARRPRSSPDTSQMSRPRSSVVPVNSGEGAGRRLPRPCCSKGEAVAPRGEAFRQDPQPSGISLKGRNSVPDALCSCANWGLPSRHRSPWSPDTPTPPAPVCVSVCEYVCECV